MEEQDGGRYCYRAYGLRLRSPVPLPELEEGGDGTDVVAHFGDTGPWPAEPIPPIGTADGTPEHLRLLWPSVGAFLLLDGRRIVIDPAPGVSERTLSLFFQGSVLASILFQRGLPIMHASAVDVGGRAVLFAGHSGSGKSTMAGAMLARGHRLIADDVSPIDLTPPVPHVLPGIPHQKLWPDSAEALGLQPHDLNPLVESVAKRGRRLAGADVETGLPVHRLYLLAGGDALSIEPLTGNGAFVYVMACSYVNLLVEKVGRAGEHFRQVTELAARVPVRRLIRPMDWQRLDEVAAAVERDLDD